LLAPNESPRADVTSEIAEGFTRFLTKTKVAPVTRVWHRRLAQRMNTAVLGIELIAPAPRRSRSSARAASAARHPPSAGWRIVACALWLLLLGLLVGIAREQLGGENLPAGSALSRGLARRRDKPHRGGDPRSAS